MGSVKDLNILKSPTGRQPGIGNFVFSDRYSVFDWGEMPDTIPAKGAASTVLGAYFFEKLEEKGIKTHYKGLFEDDSVKKLNELKNPSKTLVTEIYHVIHPKSIHDSYDYKVYKELEGNFLIPLEIIYRNTLPEGSSVFKRLKRGEIVPEDLGLKEHPKPNMIFENPIVDFSTKLEVTDRYISKAEAQEIAGLNNSEIELMSKLVLDINSLISAEYKKIGAVNLDGKIETAFDPSRTITLVDVLGTLDECRFELNGIHLSKEVARVYYRKSDWYLETERAKEKDRMNWKAECKFQPDVLPAEFRDLISFMYCEVANQITGREWFEVPMELNEIVEGIKSYIE